MKKLLVIVGATASSKTSLGVELAKRFNGEIVSADSRQVYKGMDIGTGKEKKEYGNIPVHLIDVADPKQEFSVAQYVRLAEKVIADIHKRGKLPILVGGTGFYIKALLDGIETIDIPPSPVLRMQYQDKTAEELIEILSSLNSKLADSLNESEKKNKQRLIRRIEVAQGAPQSRKQKKYDALFVGLRCASAVLYQKIDERVDKRLKQGMVQEVKKLLEKGVPHERLQKFGLEYRLISYFLQGKISQDEMVQKLKYEIHAFARRQITWFKKDKRIAWFDVLEKSWQDKLLKLVKNWYDN